MQCYFVGQLQMQALRVVYTDGLQAFTNAGPARRVHRWAAGIFKQGNVTSAEMQRVWACKRLRICFFRCWPVLTVPMIQLCSSLSEYLYSMW